MEIFVIPALRKITHEADSLLDELESLSSLSLAMLRSLREKLQDSLRQGALKIEEVCTSLEKMGAGRPLGRWGFAGQEWEARMKAQFKFEIEIIKRSDEVKGFELLPKRWVVERSFGWMNWYRRLSKDYEGHPFLSRAWLLWAMTHKMLNPLHPKPKLHPFRYRCL